MPLRSGTRLGPYEIVAPPMRGGMGQVYPARDTRLGRSVAIKVLSEDLSRTSEELARFRREARTLASLSHPHICVLHDIGREGDLDFLVMELIEGETLAHRLLRGPLPVSELLTLGAQIADALDRAHRAGIVHRDLKPGNIMLTRTGAKLMDFGLARMVHPARPGNDDPTRTMTRGGDTRDASITAWGTVMGTVPYMSPEQLDGRPVDGRGDIWALGCVLYEASTGRRAFGGETQASVISAIMRDQPRAVAELVPQVPAALERAIHQCLAKDPDDRWQTAGDLRRELVWITESGSGAVPTVLPGPRRWSRARLAWASVAALTAFFAALAVVMLASHAREPGDLSFTRLSIDFPDSLEVDAQALTADGGALVIAARAVSPDGPTSPPRLYVRPLDSNAFRLLPGTEGVTFFQPGPGGRQVLFAVLEEGQPGLGRPRVMPLDASGPAVVRSPRSIAGTREWPLKPILLPSGTLLQPTGDGTAYIRVDPDGDSPSAPETIDAPPIRGFVSFEDVLPGGRAVLFKALSYEGSRFEAVSGVLDLASGRARILERDADSPRYSVSGHLLFTRGSSILAAPFDGRRLETGGAPIGILDGLRISKFGINAAFDASADGTVAFAPAGGEFRFEKRPVVILDPNGRTVTAPERYVFNGGRLQVSPDGSRFLAGVLSPRILDEIWVSDPGGWSLRRFAAVDGVDCRSGIWSPDGRRIAYTQTAQSDTDGIYVARLAGSGAPRRIATAPQGSLLYGTSWHPDGSQILVTNVKEGQLTLEVLRWGPSGNTAPLVPLFPNRGDTGSGSFSPDGDLIGYMSDDTGIMEMYVQRYGSDGPEGEPVRVSSGGGLGPPVWTRDGRTIFFADSARHAMQATISRSPRLAVGPATPAHDAHVFRGAIDRFPDGRWIYVPAGEFEPIRKTELILHFDRLLQQRLRASTVAAR